jgi:hypothetical protein
MPKIEIDREWCIESAKREGDSEVGAGLVADTIKTYQANDVGASQCLVTLEGFIGDMDNAELADDSTVDTSDAVTAINGLIWSLEQRDAEIERLRASHAELEAIGKRMIEENERLQAAKRRALAIADERVIEAHKAKQENAQLRSALQELLRTASLLHQNAIGCATNHHGLDIELNGLPGWLVDTKASIDHAIALEQNVSGEVAK